MRTRLRIGLFAELFAHLDELGDHYDALRRRIRRAISLAMLAFAILIGSNAWFLFVVLPQKNDQIEQSRALVIKQVCEDEKTLVSIVPPAYPPLVAALKRQPDSALNPARDCDQFVRRFIRP